jgi:potassium-dependent mechanosensitive channel
MPRRFNFRASGQRDIPTEGRRVLSVVAALCVAAASLLAQSPPPGETAPARETPSSRAQSVPVSEISDRLQQTAALLRAASGRAAPVSEVQEIESSLPEFAAGVNQLLILSRRTLDHNPPLNAVRDLSNSWSLMRVRLDSWQSTLKKRSAALQQDLTALGVQVEAWAPVVNPASGERLPPEIVSQVEKTIASLQATEQVVLARRNRILELQNQIANLLIQIDEIGERLTATEGHRRQQLAQLDAPPIWKAGEGPIIKRDELPKAAVESASYSEAVKFFLLGILVEIGLLFTAFLVVLAALLYLKRRSKEWVRDEDATIRAAGLVGQRPYSAALLLTMLAGAIFQGQAPQVLISLAWLLMLIPLLRLIPGIISTEIKPALWLLALLYVADRSLQLLSRYSLAARLLVLVIAAVAAASLIWLERRLRANRSPGGWLTMSLVFVRAGAGVLLASLVCDVIGATTLSRFLLTGTLRTIYGAVLLYGAMLILQGFMRVLLRSQQPEPAPGFAERPTNLMGAFSKGLNYLGLAAFLLLTLRAFRLAKPLFAAAGQALDHTLSIGAIQFSLGSAVTFVLVVAAAAILSRFLRFLLAATVYSRIDLQRGSAESISKLLHYSILCLGVFLAMGAAGIDMSKFTLLAGAFGVGLGIGMQNIVGNFVSGLILLFERPLHVGDKITIGQTSGQVADIGIRASRIRTWDGADVIIPNANLISNEVTNWTLSDSRRRGELRVGVTYGTDPELVMRLLKETALELDSILKEPAAEAHFVGFGESSLDFVVRYWTLIERQFEASTQLHVAVGRRLASEGIEIPFPQRDVNIRHIEESEKENLAE